MPRKQFTPIPPLTANDITRFWSKVDKTPGQGPNGECWEWTACRNKNGYGKFTITRNGKKLFFYAHRICMVITHSTATESPHTLHSCDNPPCNNPDHISRGAAIDNIHDMMSKGRAYTLPHPSGESNGRHKMTENQVRELCDRYKSGERISSLMALFKIGKSTAYHILNRDTWKHVL